MGRIKVCRSYILVANVTVNLFTPKDVRTYVLHMSRKTYFLLMPITSICNALQCLKLVLMKAKILMYDILPHIFYGHLSYGVLSNFTLYKNKWKNRHFELVKRKL